MTLNHSHKRITPCTIYAGKATRRAFFILAAWLFACYSVFAINGEKEKGENANAQQNGDVRKAKEMMEKMYAYAQEQQTDNLQFSSDAYLRHRMYTKRKGPVMRYIPGMLRLEKGENDYLTEAQLRIQFRPPGEVDCRVVAYCSTAKYQRSSRLSSVSRFNFFIYDTKLLTDRILNPLNRRNRRFYRFSYQFTSAASDSLGATARINIRPRFSNDQLVSGYVDVDYETGAVRNFVFHLRYHLQKITIAGRTGKEGYASLVAEKMRILSRMRLFGNTVYETTEVRSRHRFSCPVPQASDTLSRFDLTRQCLLRIDTTQVITSPAYFDSIRPFPLRGSEEMLIARKRPENHDIANVSDSTNNIFAPETMRKMENLSAIADTAHRERRFFGERTQNVLLSSHAFNLASDGRASVKLPPIITPSMLQWSHTKGFSLKTRIRCNFFKMKDEQESRLAFNPSIGYSFKQRQIYYDLPMLLRFIPALDGKLSIVAGGGSHMYNSGQADELREKLHGIERYDSLLQIIDNYGFHDYRDSYFRTDLSLSPLPGLRVQVGTRYHRRTLITWNEIAERGGLSRKLTTLGPRLEIEWTPAQYYYKKGRRRIPLYSQWPTFMLCYERGYGFGSGETCYERIETDMHYRLPLYATRTLYFRAGGGFYTRRGNDSFLDYDYFKFDYMPANWSDDLTGEFQLLSSRWYNESRYYARLTTTYESPMLWLSRIPGARIIQKERVYLNLLSVRSLGFYTELGYGISTLLLDVGSFIGIAHDHSVDIGCRVVLKFFED